MSIGVRAALIPMARAYGFFACLPARVLGKPEIAPPSLYPPNQWADYLVAKFNCTGLRVLEVGSRVVTGQNIRHRFDKAEYIGFDYLAGENVDVVGDCHRLSSYFNERFDLIFSTAVFEHLHMPWVVAEEISKLLKVGGYAFTATHFSYASHERPWHFFQFSDMGLRALFNQGLGFKLVDKGMSGQMFGYFDKAAPSDLRYTHVKELYAFSEILVQKEREVTDFDWRKAQIDSIVGESRYPPARA